jgi:hypothetical protein
MQGIVDGMREQYIKDVTAIEQHLNSKLGREALE